MEVDEGGYLKQAYDNFDGESVVEQERRGNLIDLTPSEGAVDRDGWTEKMERGCCF